MNPLNLHKMEYQDFLKLIGKLKNVNRDFNDKFKLINLGFLDLMEKCNDTSEYLPFLKNYILSQNTFSVKISKRYLKNPNIFRNDESESIYTQITNFYADTNIRLINLAYLKIFFDSELFFDLLSCSNVFMIKKLNQITNFKQLYKDTLQLENFLATKDLNEICVKLEKPFYYGLEIHQFLIRVLKNNEIQAKNSLNLGKILDIIIKKENLFTGFDVDVDKMRNKLYEVERCNSLDLIIKKYEIEIKTCNNISQISKLFLQIFKNTTDITIQIEIMKDFSHFLNEPTFLELTSTERFKIYDHIYNLMCQEVHTIYHLSAQIKKAKYLFDIFFGSEKNIFIDNLKSKIAQLENIYKTKEEEVICKLENVINLPLLILKDGILSLNSEPDFLDIFNYEPLLNSENEKFSLHKDKVSKLRIYKKYFNTFISIINNITDYEYNLAKNIFDKVWKIIQKLINLKVKYFINSDYLIYLQTEVIKLHNLLIDHKILVNRFLSGQIHNHKKFLVDHPEIWNNKEVVNFYLNNYMEKTDLRIIIQTPGDLNKIFSILTDLYFTKEICICDETFVLDKLLNVYNKLKKCLLFFKIKSTNLIMIKEMIKYSRKERKYLKFLKKKLPRFLIIKDKPKRKKHIVQNLLFYFNSNIESTKDDITTNYKKLVELNNISKLIFGKNIDLDIDKQKAMIKLEHQKHLILYEKFHNSFLSLEIQNEQDSFIEFYNKMLDSIRKIHRLLYLERKLGKCNENESYGNLREIKYKLKFIKYHFVPLKSTNIIDFLLKYDFPNYKNKDKLMKLKSIMELKISNLKKDLILIIQEFSLQELTKMHNDLVLENDIELECNKIESNIDNLKYLSMEDRENLIFDDRLKLLKMTSDIHNILQTHMGDLISMNVIESFSERIKNLKYKVTKILTINDGTKTCILEMYKLSNITVFDNIKNEIEKPIKDINIETIIDLNLKYKNKLNNEIEQLKNKISELYFVPNDDIINLINGKFTFEDILRNIYNLDNLIIEDDNCIGFVSGSEKVIFYNKLRIVQNYNNSFEFEDFYNNFKRELNYTLYQYFDCKYKKNTVKNQIMFIDEFINEFRFFNNLPHNETSKIKFLKRHKLKMEEDFIKLYQKPSIEISNGKNISDIYDISNNYDLSVVAIQKNDYKLFYNPPSNIIFTKLTNTIFNKITIGLSSSAGIILYGESSTGKTETVKYFCRSIGVPVFVFCCNENIEMSLLENIITGCIINRWYLCLDEFNRLSSSIMSKLSDLILENLSKNNNFKIFLTLNLGYLGRNKIPTTLKSLFNEIRVDNPNVEDILDVYFTKEVKEMMLNFKILSSNLQHYNFSLRAINTILYNLDKYQENLDRSLFMYYYALFNTKDRKLLNGYIKELSYYDLFTYGIKRNTGVLLYGESLTGKSYLIKKAIKDTKVKYKILYKFDELILYNLLKENIKEDFWIIYDCILESHWIENLNSVLDDNKILCMNNGEVLKIGKNIRFIFETNDITRLTPATLTRVFTIYFDNRYTIDDYKSHVLFLQGPVGIGKRKYFIENINVFLGSILYLNCKNLNTLHGCVPIDYSGFIYLEEFEYASELLCMEIKEFYENKSINCIIYNSVNIVISYNDDDDDDLVNINFRRRINWKIIKIKKENVIEQIKDKKIKNLFSDDLIRYDECIKIENFKSKKNVPFDFLINLFVRDSELCFKEFINFCFDQKINFILLGDRLSGKNYILSDFADKLNIINIYRDNVNIKISEDKINAILTDDLDKIPKVVLKKCLVYRLYSAENFIISFTEFLEDLKNNNFCYSRNISSTKIIKNIEMKNCDCCIRNTFLVENAEYFSKECNSDLISFNNIYKLHDFCSTVYKNYKKYTMHKNYILEGLDKINEFNNMYKSKEENLIKNNKKLNTYEFELKNKLLDIENLKKEIDKEKINIMKKKENLDKLLSDINNKKDLVSIRLDSGDKKLEESILKIKKINKMNLAELKCMNSPPKAIHIVVNTIYNMINKVNIKKSWSDLLIFLRSNDIFNFINNIDNINTSDKNEKLNLDIEELKMKEKEIFKSSKVCFIFYEWIISNQEYKNLKKDIKPLEDEIEMINHELNNIKDSIYIEENKYKDLEIKLKYLQDEYNRNNKNLQNTKEELQVKDKELLRIKKLNCKLSEEINKWIVPEFNIKYILERWYEYNKILIINCNDKQVLNIPEIDKKFIVTSTKDINFLQIINNVYKYKNNLIINDIYRFDENIYKLCKFQIKSKDFFLVLNDENNLYENIGYSYKIIDEISHKSEINLKELEDKLLKDIHDDLSIDCILDSKYNLDIKREEYQKYKNIKYQINLLNNCYFKLNEKFNLSFKVFEEYLKVNNILDESFNVSIFDQDKLFTDISLYCSELHIEDIYKYNTNVLIITNTDDYIYFLEQNLNFNKIISIGDKISNIKFKEILINNEKEIYLIKNVDLYDDIIINKSSNKFIFISEYSKSRNIVKDCRIINMKYVFNYERSIEFYNKLYKNNEDLITLHCSMIKKIYDNNLQKKYLFSIKDLELLIKSKDYCSIEYLKYLIYINKLDKEDLYILEQ